MLAASLSGDDLHVLHRLRHHEPFVYLGQAEVIGYEKGIDRPSRFRLRSGGAQPTAGERRGRGIYAGSPYESHSPTLAPWDERWDMRDHAATGMAHQISHAESALFVCWEYL